jgi:hypothetical protein
MEKQQSIGLDVHKDYSVFRIFESPGGIGPAIRVSHGNGELQRFLITLPPGPAPALLEDLQRQTPEGRRRKFRTYANADLLCIDLCEVISNVE